MASSKLPAIQFYPGDWRKDVGVQALSFHDRGVWFEILMLMHGSEQRGVLTLNGKAMTDEALARVLGLDKQTLTTVITAILDTGVASRHESSGALMSRRMVRDEALHVIRKECGKLGGNPRLRGATSEDLDKQNATMLDMQKPTPSSSSSSSSSNTSSNTKTNTLARSQLDEAEIERIYQIYPRKVGRMKALIAIRKAIAHLGTGENWPVLSIENAIKLLREKASRFARSPAGNQGEFTPHPATWFNGGRYLDDETEWQNGGQPKGAKNGTGNGKRGDAVGRVKRSLDAWDRVTADRIAARNAEPVMPANAGLLPPSGVRRGDDTGLPI